MKKKIALSVALVGSALLALSLAVFGIGAAASLNPTPHEALPDHSAKPVGIPAAAIVPAVTAAPVTPEATAAIASGITDPTTSDAFNAMSPDEQANGRVWIETQTITAECMRDKGYTYTFEPFWDRDNTVLPVVRPVMWVNTLPASERAAARLALDGDTGAGADYHWDDAGCWGYAVHVMGNDNAH